LRRIAAKGHVGCKETAETKHGQSSSRMRLPADEQIKKNSPGTAKISRVT
jgi:hypothetical protein